MYKMEGWREKREGDQSVLCVISTAWSNLSERMHLQYSRNQSEFEFSASTVHDNCFWWNKLSPRASTLTQAECGMKTILQY